jgi:hypothetical protein
VKKVVALLDPRLVAKPASVQAHIMVVFRTLDSNLVTGHYWDNAVTESCNAFLGGITRGYFTRYSPASSLASSWASSE